MNPSQSIRNEAVAHAVQAGTMPHEVVQTATTIEKFILDGDAQKAPIGTFEVHNHTTETDHVGYREEIDRLENLIRDKDIVNEALREEIDRMRGLTLREDPDPAAFAQKIEDYAQSEANRIPWDGNPGEIGNYIAGIMEGAKLLRGEITRGQDAVMGVFREVPESEVPSEVLAALKEQEAAEEAAPDQTAGIVFREQARPGEHVAHTCPTPGCGSVHLPPEPDGEPMLSGEVCPDGEGPDKIG